MAGFLFLPQALLYQETNIRNLWKPLLETASLLAALKGTLLSLLISSLFAAEFEGPVHPTQEAWEDF